MITFIIVNECRMSLSRLPFILFVAFCSAAYFPCTDVLSRIPISVILIAQWLLPVLRQLHWLFSATYEWADIYKLQSCMPSTPVVVWSSTGSWWHHPCRWQWPSCSPTSRHASSYVHVTRASSPLVGGCETIYITVLLTTGRQSRTIRATFSQFYINK